MTTAGGAPARILIVDDHPLFRHGVGELLAREPGIEVCGQVGDAAAARRELERGPLPDLMILDVRREEHGQPRRKGWRRCRAAPSARTSRKGTVHLSSPDC